MTRFSAWDVAGAVVWTWIAAFLWGCFWGGMFTMVNLDIRHALELEGAATLLSLAAVYCWARLLGARG